MEMPKDKLEELLATVFEQMAFMFADPAETAPIQGKALRVKMHYAGSQNGDLMLAVPEAMAQELAANLLGTDQDSPEGLAAAGDALREMLNVLCGHVVTLLAGPDGAFELSPPLMENGSPEDWAAWSADPDALAMSVEGHPILLQLHREES